MNYTKQIFMRLTNTIKPKKNCLPAAIRLAFLAVFGLFCSFSVSAQGWEHYYGGDEDDEVSTVLEIRDHGYIIVGNTKSGTGMQERNIYAARIDVDGVVLWEKNYPIDFLDLSDEFGNGVVEAHDGGFVIVGTTFGGGSFGERDVLLFKIDSLGNKQWENFYGTGGFNEEGYAIAATTDGGYIITGKQFVDDPVNNNDVYVVKVDVLGNLEWENHYGSPDSDDEGRSIIQTPDGGFIIAGSTGELDERDVLIFKIGADQMVDWEETYGGGTADQAYSLIRTDDNHYAWAGRYSNAGNFYIGKFQDNGNGINNIWVREFGDPFDFEEARSIRQTRDGGYIIAGTAEINSGVDPQLALVKTNANGIDQWTKLHGKSTAWDFGLSVTETTQGGFVIAGFTFQNLSILESDAIVLKTDSEGNIYSNYIQGKVFYDIEDDCQYNGNETGIRNWIVKAVGPETLYGTTDAEGNYSILADTFQYEVFLIKPNEYWQACVPSYNINFSQPYDTIVRNFPVGESILCTDLEVDISTPFLEVCSTSVYQVIICNHGTLNAQNAKLNLILDDDITYIDSEPAIFTQVDSLYTFDVGNLAVGACKTAWVSVEVDCDAKLSQAHCIKAHITPDEICLPAPNWDGSSLAVNGYCDGDSVRFEIKNAGLETFNADLNYIVIEDVIIGLEEQPIGDLPAGESKSMAFPADGTTYRLVIPSPYQAEGHPGNSRPTIAVEGCVAGGGTDFTTGFYTQLPEDDKDHFRSTDCQENLEISTTDPQLKRGYPKGYGDDCGQIVTDTDLKFHIKFRNTGIDTAIRVVIRDTISPFLDPQTVRPGASSHDYEFEVYGNGILKFTFNNIIMADSSTSFAESVGFVKYRISQKPDNPIGSTIKNSAAIYFDYDDPLNTGETCHMVAGDRWTDFISVSTQEVFLPNVHVNVYPNPFVDFAVFEIEGLQSQAMQFNVFDLAGKQVRSERFDAPKFEFYRKNLPPGMYVYRIESKGILVAVGKIIIHQ